MCGRGHFNLPLYCLLYNREHYKNHPFKKKDKDKQQDEEFVVALSTCHHLLKTDFQFPNVFLKFRSAIECYYPFRCVNCPSHFCYFFAI